MTDALRSLPLLVTILLLGHATMRVIGLGPRSDRLGFFAWSYLVGALVFALSHFLWIAIGKPVGIIWWLVAVYGVALAVLRRARANPLAEPIRVESPAFDRWVLGAGIALLAFALLDRITFGNAGIDLASDEANIWAAKARVLFSAGGFDAELALRSAEYVAHKDYPLLVPLMLSSVFEWSGEVLLLDHRLPVQLFALAMLMAMASALSRFARPIVTVPLLLMFFALRSVIETAGLAYADMLIAFGLLVMVDAWLRFESTEDAAYLRLSCLAGACLCFAKNEGSMLLLLFAALVWFTRTLRGGSGVPSLRRHLPWLLAPFAIVLLNEFLKWHQGFGNDLFDASHEQGFAGRLFAGLADRGHEVGRFFLVDIFLSIDAGRLLLLLTILVAGWRIRRLRNDAALLPTLLALTGVAAYALVFVATPHDLSWHLNTAAARVCMPPTAVAALAVGMMLGATFPALRAQLVTSQAVTSRASDPRPDDRP